MHKKLIITRENELHKGLQRVIGRRAISQFIAALVRPHVVGADLNAAYADMADDEARERAAQEWVEKFSNELSDEGAPGSAV